MTTDMAPPPSRNPNAPESHSEPETKTEMANNPDDQRYLQSDPPQTSDDSNSATEELKEDALKKKELRNNVPSAPYTIPPWSGTPKYHFFLEVLKDGAIIDQFDVLLDKKGAYMFGRVDLCDFVLDHPTISRFHAVLQFNSDGGAFLYDLGSTHGTFINKNQVKKKDFVDLHVGDVIRFGHSSRLYIFQGPSELMRPEADLKAMRNAKLRQETQDMEASLLRARVDASRADGISWGMREDAIEENEDDMDEITWQTYKGLLTEKQEKTREKVIKRLEKVAHMKKEIDAIRAKDISQGGLTQGQQTQIARNEQRISQIMEELENLEETLNESIRESMGARTGRLPHSKKGMTEDDEENYLSDDDEFYDRTKKPSKRKDRDNQQSVETAESLLDKKDAITKKIEEKEKLLLDEDKTPGKSEAVETGDDALDAYMSSVSSQLVLDGKEKLSKELEGLKLELDRILYLLKIADPMSEAAKKRESRGQKPNAVVKERTPLLDKDKKSFSSLEKNRESISKDSFVKAVEAEANAESKSETETGSKSEEPESNKAAASTNTNTTTVYTVPKPQWLGAVEEKKKQEIPQQMPTDTVGTGEFVDYKDRNKMLTSSSQEDVGLENAAPGLIIRKRKEVEKPNVSDEAENHDSESMAASAVALLLKHSRGVHVSSSSDDDGTMNEDRGQRDAKKPKRVVQGPQKPTFLESDETDYTWVPPQGQSGDGHTSLNDRFGY